MITFSGNLVLITVTRDMVEEFRSNVFDAGFNRQTILETKEFSVFAMSPEEASGIYGVLSKFYPSDVVCPDDRFLTDLAGNQFEASHNGRAFWLNGINSCAARTDGHTYEIMRPDGSVMDNARLPGATGKSRWNEFCGMVRYRLAVIIPDKYKPDWANDG